MRSRRVIKRKKKSRRLKRRIFLFMVLVVLCFAGIIHVGNLLREQAVGVQPSGKTVKIEEMPEYVSKAFVAVEDERYYYHFGVDPVGLARAIRADMEAGGFVQGGSTITMQAARNIYLSHDKTIMRKVKEMIIAINLEWYYSKEEILEMYMNHIYFGSGNYGIEAAANEYFGKTTTKNNSSREVLTPQEAAVLAGMVKAPEYYANNPEKAEKRGEVVYKKMDKLGYLPTE
ncbi:biosynthetic peptidoglycan transglycosylase [Bacillus tianshenii]|nr:biosynthetic peptidoglycan transglycosylase [Bacillus tianshenii]